jgi:flagellar hook-associated protein 2
MYDSLYKAMGSTDYSSIYKVYDDKRLKDEYDDYTTKISDAEDKLNDYEDRWYSKFSSMETALSKLQNSSSVVSSMLGTS